MVAPPGESHLKSARIRLVLALVLLASAVVYWPGLRGGFEFDDYPNIVDATALHVESLSLTELSAAAWASPASDFQRPLASLSFALNHYFTGLAPGPMKLTNLAIHLLNGLLLFVLLRRLPGLAAPGNPATSASGEMLALLVTALWLLHPINLTGVLYVVQRMESLAQVFVLLGLILYVEGRSRLAAGTPGVPWRLWLGVPACVVAGATAKETAVLLPVLTLVLEFTLFRARPGGRQMLAFHIVFLVFPAVVGLSWLLPRTMDSPAWIFRDFTMMERLLTQPGVLLSYLAWTVLPLPGFFGFFRDAWPVSTGLLHPWTTLPALAGLTLLVAAVFALRRRRPLVALGLGWFLAAHLLTATILPLELVFEHRNYFASVGALLALVALLWPQVEPGARFNAVRTGVLAGILVLAGTTLLLRVLEWADPVRLAVAEADRNPASSRAAYNLGRTLVVLGGYDPDSPLTREAAGVLRRAMALDGSGLLPPVALLMLADRTGQTAPADAWAAIEQRLRSRGLTPEDSTAIRTLIDCQVEQRCRLPDQAMLEMLVLASSKEPADAMVLYAFARFAYNRLGDEPLALTLARDAASAGDPQYQLNLVEFLAATGHREEALAEFGRLRDRVRAGQFAAQMARIEQRLDCMAGEGAPAEAGADTNLGHPRGNGDDEPGVAGTPCRDLD